MRRHPANDTTKANRSATTYACHMHIHYRWRATHSQKYIHKWHLQIKWTTMIRNMLKKDPRTTVYWPGGSKIDGRTLPGSTVSVPAVNLQILTHKLCSTASSNLHVHGRFCFPRHQTQNTYFITRTQCNHQNARLWKKFGAPCQFFPRHQAQFCNHQTLWQKFGAAPMFPFGKDLSHLNTHLAFGY